MAIRKRIAVRARKLIDAPTGNSFTSGRYGDRMDQDRRNLVARIAIVSAYIKALEDPEKLLRVCGDVLGDVDEARAAVATAFDVSDVAADAILDLQVRRFTPRSVERMRSELADFNRRLVDLDQP
jgi:DNA gyrase/topoisomerase IV subunit A